MKNQKNMQPGNPGPTILIVDDDPYIREELHVLLEEPGYHCVEARDGKEALASLKAGCVDLLLLDLRLPRVNGMTVLKRSMKLRPDLPVIVISGTGTISLAVEATKLGAFDFLEKPLARERILLTVRNALEQRRLALQRDNLLSETERQLHMIGRDAKMVSIFRVIERAAQVDSKVLIIGESGTGKELVARAIHYKSKRACSKFVALNCAAVPETLIESTLFGSVKGAYTGAITRGGKFQLANCGTLFLDEVTEMSLQMQAKLLRAIEYGEVEPVGSNDAVPVDVRIVAASSTDLKGEVRTGNFRNDLYFRIGVLTVSIPPLRERLSDLVRLSEFLLQEICSKHGLPNMTFAPEVWLALKRYHWPGNVRELSNVIEHAAVFNEDEQISETMIDKAIEATSLETMRSQKAETLRAARRQFEAEFIRQTLAAHGGSIQETAAALGIQRSHLWKKMQQYGIGKPK